jgi:hypothetical protein
VQGEGGESLRRPAGRAAPAGRADRRPDRPQASEVWRAQMNRARGGGADPATTRGDAADDHLPRDAGAALAHLPEGDGGGPEVTDAEEWILVETIRADAEDAVGRGRQGGRGPASARDAGGASSLGALDEVSLDDADLRAQLLTAVGTPRAARLEQRIKEAGRHFNAERFPEARKLLTPVAAEAPSVAAVRELLGVTLYRLGRWRAAAKELEAFRLQTGSTEQHPVLADCYRALRRYAEVEQLWDELRAASPDADLVMEGRIVTAGALADRGELRAAIALLQQPGRFPKRPQERHLRRAYAVADLYERVGDVPRAREWFRAVRDHDPDFADVRQRLRNLG